MSNKKGEGSFFQTLLPLLFLFTTAFSLIFLYGCGIPTYAYLYPPTDAYDRGDPEDTTNVDLIFRNAYKNSLNIFSGYEIYYKIYDPIGSTSGSYLEDYNSIRLNASADYSTLNTKGFSRLYTTTDTSLSYIHTGSKPAFPIDSSMLQENFFIRFIFNQELDAGYKYIAETYDSSLSFSPLPVIYRYVRNKTDSTLDPRIRSFDIDDLMSVMQIFLIR